MDNEVRQTISEPGKTGCLPLIVRLAWMIAGNGLLFFTAIFIAQQRAGIVLDILFWVVVAGLVLIRYLDITLFHGQTAENEPATLAHWRRYSIQVIAISAVVWIAAHGVARFL